MNHYEKKKYHIRSFHGTLYRTGLGLSACGGKTNTPQTIPAVNDTVKETAKDGASDASRELDAVSEKDASTKQIYDDRLSPMPLP